MVRTVKLVAALAVLTHLFASPGCSRDGSPHPKTVDASDTGDGQVEGKDSSVDRIGSGSPEVSPEGGVATACFRGLGAPPKPVVSKAPLIAEPKVVWTKKLGGLVATGDRVVIGNGFIAATAAGVVYFVNKRTQAVKSWGSGGIELFNTITVGNDGNVLVSGFSAYAVTPEGTLSWQVNLGPPIDNEWSFCDTSYSKSSNTLFSLCNNGQLYGLRIGALAPSWSSRFYVSGALDSRIMPGFGDILSIAPGPRLNRGEIQFFAAEDGQALVAPGNIPGAGFALYSGGLLTSQPTMKAYDKCGRLLWETGENDQYVVPIVVGLPDETIFAMAGTVSSSAGRKLQLHNSATGAVVAERLAADTETPIAAGADGAYYSLTCSPFSSEETPAAPEIVAYDSALNEKWRKSLVIADLGAPTYRCPRWGVALDLDGMLYLVAEERTGTFVMAVQTQSPGPAPTVWPLHFGDNRGTNWAE